MLWRTLACIAPLAAGWMVLSGAIPLGALWGGGTHQAEVERPVEAVAAALANMRFDSVAQFGIPRLVAEAVPAVRMARTADGYRWALMSGGGELMVMTATLAPVHGGAGTRVTTAVQRGSGTAAVGVPVRYQRPELFSEMFAAAVETELDVFQPAGKRLSDEQLRNRRLDAQARMMALRVAANPIAVGLAATHMHDPQAETRATEAAERASRDEADRHDRDRRR